jgi:hypothetical protein
MKARGAVLLLTAALALAGCDQQGSQTKVTSAKADKSKSAEAGGNLPAATGEQLGTPMAERIAVISLLNKRNGQTRDFELKPGQSVRMGKVALFVRACERTAPWETYPDEGAFVRVAVRERPPGTNDSERWRWAFSGWLFKENPAANIMQHPVYDVWIKACKMSFPGEEPAPGELSAPSEKEDRAPSNAPQSPGRPKAEAAPAPPPEPDEDAPAEGEGEATVET